MIKLKIDIYHNISLIYEKLNLIRTKKYNYAIKYYL